MPDALDISLTKIKRRNLASLQSQRLQKNSRAEQQHYRRNSRTADSSNRRKEQNNRQQDNSKWPPPTATCAELSFAGWLATDATTAGRDDQVARGMLGQARGEPSSVATAVQCNCRGRHCCQAANAASGLSFARTLTSNLSYHSTACAP